MAIFASPFTEREPHVPFNPNFLQQGHECTQNTINKSFFWGEILAVQGICAKLRFSGFNTTASPQPKTNISSSRNTYPKTSLSLCFSSSSIHHHYINIGHIYCFPRTKKTLSQSALKLASYLSHYLP